MAGENPDAVPPSHHMLPATTCPVCKHALSCAWAPGDSSPRPSMGDMTICRYCRVILVFTWNLRLRILANKEWAKLSRIEREVLTDMRERIAVQGDGT